jgi:hypothetical protein
MWSHPTSSIKSSLCHDNGMFLVNASYAEELVIHPITFCLSIICMGSGNIFTKGHYVCYVSPNGMKNAIFYTMHVLKLY